MQQRTRAEYRAGEVSTKGELVDCVGVRPPKMKVGVLLIARALSCLDF